jgi:hypothetical protein
MLISYPCIGSIPVFTIDQTLQDFLVTLGAGDKTVKESHMQSTKQAEDMSRATVGKEMHRMTMVVAIKGINK